MKRTRKRKMSNEEKYQERLRAIPTPNGKMVYELMLSRNVKGKYKDYVIINGSRMIDWLGTYEMIVVEKNMMESLKINGIALIHKSNLHKLLGKETASKFWTCGRRTNYGVESRNSKCVVDGK